MVQLLLRLADRRRTSYIHRLQYRHGTYGMPARTSVLLASKHPAATWTTFLPRPPAAPVLFSLAPLSAAVSATLWYAAGMLPPQLALISQLGLDAQHTASWLCIVWLSSGVVSVALALLYRQPLSLTSSTPALVYLVAMGSRFAYPELMGACAVAGLVSLLLGMSGLAGRLLRWLPVSLALGMLAGSLVENLVGLGRAAVVDPLVVGPTMLAYVVARRVPRLRCAGVGLAALCGAATLAVSAVVRTAPPGWLTVGVIWQPPILVPVAPEISARALLSLVLPLVLLSLGLGHVQGVGYLRGQRYSVPEGPVTVAVGAISLVNAVFGGHPGNVSRIGVAFLAGPQAGRWSSRYVAVVLAGGGMLVLGCTAGTLAHLVALLPASYIVSLAGLALVEPFVDALRKALGGPLPRGALVTFAVAALPLSLGGLPASLWALVAGVVASLLLERSALLATWRARPDGDPLGTAGSWSTIARRASSACLCLAGPRWAPLAVRHARLHAR